MTPSPPLRFLAVVLGGWTALRAAMLAPAWWTGPAPSAAPPAEVGSTPRPALHSREDVQLRAVPAPAPALRTPATGRRPSVPAVGEAGGLSAAEAGNPEPRPPPGRGAAPFVPRPPGPVPGPEPDAGASRWALYGWTFVRAGGTPSLVPGGMLGGSQAGLRATYRLNQDSGRPVALSVRLTSPLGGRAGAEAALGLDWRPSRRLPLHLLAERRQRLGREGRSAFSVTLHGGVGEAPLGPFRVDAYAQAGIVGARSRDLFADGSVRASLPLGERVRLGAGAWAAAQPGVARLDFGPQATLRLPVAGGNLTVAADWRLRVAGDAGPGSGPALTLSTDF